DTSRQPSAPLSGELACGGVGCEREPGAPKTAGWFVNRKESVLLDDHVVQARTTLHSAPASFASASSSLRLVPHASPPATVRKSSRTRTPAPAAGNPAGSRAEPARRGVTAAAAVATTRSMPLSRLRVAIG